MRLAASLHVAVLLAAAEVTMATPSPSITAAPTASNNLLNTATSEKPSVFTTISCSPNGNTEEAGEYVRHNCKVYEHRLKELESGAGFAVPFLGSLWEMAAAAVIVMLF
ncbi:uncharacterized protein B0T23DRAFT_398067 [Neurospora hispaniola]|uniref:Uncharacterized protein n=1 Tax=Neurospora hispaniola TaxID=588809 RepID=A0AAJ0I4D7_9PEZI|nr:hypothetical protein B0T23DRAFT_398067 [Neurospora hispaniola]